MTPEERRDRLLRSFARMHAATADADEVVRLSIESLCRRVDAGGMDAADARSTLDLLDELLTGEIARRHR